MRWVFDRLFRSPDVPFRVGDRVELGRMSVEIESMTDDLRPKEALFRFSAPLEDASWRWLTWHDGQFVSFVPPAIGETVELRIH
jgi:hypothetical protein